MSCVSIHKKRCNTYKKFEMDASMSSTPTRNAPMATASTRLNSAQKQMLERMKALLFEQNYDLLSRNQILEATADFLLERQTLMYPVIRSGNNRAVKKLLREFEADKLGISFDGNAETSRTEPVRNARGLFCRASPVCSPGDNGSPLRVVQGQLTKAKEWIRELESRIELLRRQVEEKNREIDVCRTWRDAVLNESDDNICWWRNSRLHFLTAYHNLCSLKTTGRTNGFRYPSEMHNVYVMLYLSGRFWYHILHDIFGFPSVTAIKRFYHQAKEMFGVDSSLYNGKPENIRRILERHKFSHDKRCVVSIDATALKSNFGLTLDGRVIGCVTPRRLEIGLAREILADRDKYHEFEQANLQHIAKSVFVILVNPLDPTLAEFPVVVLAYTQGQVDDRILRLLQHTNKILADCGLEVIGNGFDGDPKFLQYGRSICEKLPKMIFENIHVEIPRLFMSQGGLDTEIAPFYDPNHTAKCDRYRRVIDESVKVFFTVDASEFTKKDLLSIGVSEYVMSDSTVRKMDDVLPRLLFNTKNLESCVKNRRLDLFIALFPTTALLLAIMDESLSRADRIDLLCDAFCVMFLYHLALTSYGRGNECNISIRRNKTGKPLTIWHTDFICKFLSSVLLIIKVLCDERPVNLGALGSHHNENYFGCIKRLSHGDESVEGFQRTAEKAFLLRALLDSQGLPTARQCGRISMSGARIPENETYGGTMAIHMCKAWFLWRRVAEFSGPSCAVHLEDTLSSLSQSLGLRPWVDSSDAMQMLPESVRTRKDEDTATITARKMRIVSVDGVKCKQRWITGQQLKPVDPS